VLSPQTALPLSLLPTSSNGELLYNLVGLFILVMASRGRTVAGTDGNDYLHRETVVQQYHVSAETKSKLKWTTFFHLTLGALMLAKLLPEILDKLDIFVMEVEELFLPKPLIWEWMWIGSVVGTLFSWMASKKSNILQMRIFQITTLVLGVLPILIGMGVHFSDAYAFISEDKKTKILKWMGLPVAMLWYGFFLLALQAHSMQLYFSNVLVAAWQPKRKLK